MYRSVTRVLHTTRITFTISCLVRSVGSRQKRHLLWAVGKIFFLSENCLFNNANFGADSLYFEKCRRKIKILSTRNLLFSKFAAVFQNSVGKL